MIWALYGLFHSLARAGFTETNRLFKVDGWHLAFLQAVFAVLFLLPFIPFMAWPADGRFYFAAVIVALISTVGVLVQLILSSRKSGRVSSIYMPLEAFAAFLIWVAIVPAVYQTHVDDPLMTVSVLLAFIMSAVALLRIRRNDVNLGSFSLVAPIGISYAVAGVVTKIVMPEENILPAALAYVLINFVVMAFIVGTALVFKRKLGGALIEKRLLKAGLLTGVFSFMAAITFVTGVGYAPNPGYTSAMAMLLPVWLMIFHKFCRIDDNASPFAAMLIILGVLILIVAA